MHKAHAWCQTAAWTRLSAAPFPSTPSNPVVRIFTEVPAILSQTNVMWWHGQAWIWDPAAGHVTALPLLSAALQKQQWRDVTLLQRNSKHALWVVKRLVFLEMGQKVCALKASHQHLQDRYKSVSVLKGFLGCHQTHYRSSLNPLWLIIWHGPQKRARVWQLRTKPVDIQQI